MAVATRTLTAAALVALMALSSQWTPVAAGGAVQVLTDGTFDAALGTGGVWLVKFYAPWCGHCKHIAPIFEAAAERVAGQINFAEVDATAEDGLKTRFEVEGYPTIKYFVDGEPFLYQGKRTEDGFALFASRITGPDVHVVSGSKKLNALLDDKENKVVFAYFKTESDDEDEAYDTYRSVAKTLKANHVFAATKSAELAAKHDRPTPFVAKLEPGEDAVYLEVDEDFSEESLRDFIEANQFRLLSKDEDFGGLASSNRFVAAAVVDPEAGGKTSKFMKKIKKLARNRPGKSGSPPLAASVRDKFHFMELDGVQWAEFLEQLNVTPDQLPRVVVIDRPNHSFYEDPDVTDVTQFLVDVAEGRVRAQRDDFWGMPARTWKKMMAWSPYSFIGVAAVVGLMGYACFLAPEDDYAEPSVTQNMRKKYR